VDAGARARRRAAAERVSRATASRLRDAACGVLLLLVYGTRAPAQSPRDGEARLAAHRTAAIMHLDGILDEAAWLQADSITDLRQQDPDEGAPATERTVIRVLAGPDGLHVGFWCFDRDPAGLRRTQLRRDFDTDADDFVALLLDPQGDRRTGVYLAVNPNGARLDGELIGNNDTNDDWDGVWDARARVTPEGYTVEIVIPWQMLRYPLGVERWGFNAGRMIRRGNEPVLWRGWLRQQGLFFQEAEGTLEVPPDLPLRRPFEARPYVAATAEAATRDYYPGGDSITAAGSTDAKIGFDGKLAVLPRMNLDVTVNTDFAQVEADQQVVNLTRFPVFFPEKRGFFLESAGIFEFGQAERTQLFHSRRIGLDSVGNVVPIVAGARLTGRAGPERLGLLAVRTGGDEDALDVVARVQHDVFSRGYVGAMGTFQGGPGIADDRMGGGLDFNVPLLLHGQNIVPAGFVAVTDNHDGRPPASAWRLFLDYPNDWADGFIAVSRLEEAFDPALGFVRQTGIYRGTAGATFYPRPHRWGIRRLVIKPLEFDVNHNLDGSLNNTWYEIIPLGAEFESGDQFELSVQRTTDVPADSFEIFGGVIVPPGRYAWDRVELQVESYQGRAANASLSVNTGGLYDGTATGLEYEAGLRLAPHVIAHVEGGWDRVDLPGGSFTAQQHSLRLDYATSPRLNTTLFVQWNNESDRLAVNARLHWIPRPGTDAYLVWNSTWPAAAGAGIPWQRPVRGALEGKFVYYFRV